MCCVVQAICNASTNCKGPCKACKDETCVEVSGACTLQGGAAGTCDTGVCKVGLVWHFTMGPIVATSAWGSFALLALEQTWF